MTVSTYQSGAEAYRSTVKWLVAFVPFAAIVAAIIALGPDLVAQLQSSRSIGDFLSSHAAALVGAVVIAIGIALVIAPSSWVLAAQPKDLSKISDAELDLAFGAGVAAPYFIDRPTYDDASSRLLNFVDSQRVSNGAPDKPEAPDAELVKALAGAVDSLRDWSLHRDLASRFRTFQLCFWAGVSLMLVGLIVSAVNLSDDQPAYRDPPTLVTVQLDALSRADLVKATGCSAASVREARSLRFWLVGGTWDNPTLQVDGPGCALDTNWVPTASVRPRPSGSAETPQRDHRGWR